MMTTRQSFERELQLLRESLLRMASLVESQIDRALTALRTLDSDGADEVRRNDQTINELFRQIREQVFLVLATQQPVARDLRTLMGVQYIAQELERIGDYAVRIARRTAILCGLPQKPLRVVTLIQVAHNLERIGDRVTNVAEDIIFLESGQVVELG